jgi:hypothetical protein
MIALLVLGLPLLAWWIGGRRIWSRVEIRSGADPASAIIRRYGLTHAQAATVTSAVSRGQALDDPAQRAAAVELAQLTLDQLHPSWEQASRGRRLVRILGWLWILTAVTGLVFAVAFGHLGDVNGGTTALVLVAVLTPVVQRHRLRRTIALNSDAADRGLTGQPAVSARSVASRVRRGRTSTSRTARASAPPPACTIDRWLCARVSAV